MCKNLTFRKKDNKTLKFVQFGDVILNATWYLKRTFTSFGQESYSDPTQFVFGYRCAQLLSPTVKYTQGITTYTVAKEVRKHFLRGAIFYCNLVFL